MPRYNLCVLRIFKVEEIRLVKEDLMKRKKNYLSRKLQEAEEKRQQQLRKVVKKAHEEENKVMMTCNYTYTGCCISVIGRCYRDFE